MNTRTRLLHRLADGEWHTGPSLAGALGISRAAVAKAVNALDAMGLPVERGRQGYCVPARLQPPRADQLAKSLPAAARERLLGLQTLYRVDSTNSWLLRRSSEEDAAGSHVCIAAKQTAGRGRLGRAWDSPPGAGLYLSISHSHAGAPASAMPLAVASQIADAVESVVPGVQLRLKWPNDLLLDGAKVGGILMESRGEYGGQWQVVIGLGLNLEGPAEDGRTSLAAAGFPATGHGALAAALLSRLLPGIPAAAADPRAWLEQWRARDFYRGRTVRVRGPRIDETGVAAGIEDDGALLLDTPVGRVQVTGGDVSLRET